MANFDCEFFSLVFPGFQATQKIHAQNSRPELSASLSNFTFLNPKFIHGDFLLTGETKKVLWDTLSVPDDSCNQCAAHEEVALQLACRMSIADCGWM